VNLLLDTHVLIWWDAGVEISPEGIEAIQGARQVFVSAASAWEIAIKAELGKIRSTRTVAQACEAAGFEELPVTFAHAAAVQRLKRVHRDPFDRLLVAQALEEGLTVATRDPVFARYGVKVREV
jgi:PIN domain nuclease of toxin-antitoxin system